MEHIFICSSQSSLNEDNYLVGDDYLVLIDGATNLGEKSKFNANWFVCEIVKFLKVELDKKYDLKETLRNSINKIKEQVEEGYNNVSCSIIIARVIENKLEYLSLGDCTGVLQFNDETKVLYNESLSILDNKSLALMKELSIKNNISIKDTLQEVEVKNILLKHRNLKNKSNGYYSCDLSNEGIDNADFYIFEKSNIKNILLMSDGFDDIVSKYKIYENYDLLINDIYELGIDVVLKKLYDMQDSDSNLNEFIRFKKSDDATCILAKL